MTININAEYDVTKKRIDKIVTMAEEMLKDKRDWIEIYIENYLEIKFQMLELGLDYESLICVEKYIRRKYFFRSINE